MNRDDFPAPTEGIAVTHFLVAKDIAITARFYAEVLGGDLVFEGEGSPSVVKLANTWIIVNVGGGPTPDKPEVTLEASTDRARADAFMNIRVADIESVYEEWSNRGAEFLTQPLDNNGVEMRCYVRDPDGRIIEVGQATGMIQMLGLDGG